jgi:hypothetical protein
MLEDVSDWERDAHAPQMLEVAHESSDIVDGWTCIRIAAERTWDEDVGGTCGIHAIRTVGTINTDPTFPFLDGPLDGV